MLNLFNPKMALNIYFLGIIFGGLAFLLVYNVLPKSMVSVVTGLVGASAGVRALLIFLCSYMPQTEVRLIAFNIKLWYLGVALVVIDIMGLFSLNLGGSVAHLGGNFQCLASVAVLAPGVQGFCQQGVDVQHLHPFVAHRLGKDVVILLSLLYPKHIIKQQLLAVTRGQATVRQTRPADYYLTQTPRFRMHTKLLYRHIHFSLFHW